MARKPDDHQLLLDLIDAVELIEPLLREVSLWPPGSKLGAQATSGCVYMTQEQARDVLQELEAARAKK